MSSPKKRQAPQPNVTATVAAPAKSPIPPAVTDPKNAPAAEKADNNNPQDKPAAESESEESGGLSGFKKADQLISRVVSKVEDEIKVRINELRKADKPLKPNDKLEIVGYRSNVVAGFIYFAKIKISGESFIQARILETPKGDILLQSVTETKTLEDEEEYFKLPKSTDLPSVHITAAGVKAPIDSAQKSDKENISNKEDLEPELLCGGLSNFKKADHVISRVVSKVEDEIKTRIKELRKDDPLEEKLEIVGYRSNVVAGFLYFAKIKIPGNSFIQARIFENTKGDISLQSVTETKTEADEKEYFKLP